MLNLLRSRRSIRSFEDRPVDIETRAALEEVLLRSPSSRNIQPWTFVFVDDRDALEALARAKKGGGAFLARAPLAVAVLADESRSDVWVEDTSIAAAYLHLAAHGLGLGSCWIQIRLRSAEDGADAEARVREIVGAPPSMRVLCLVALGWPAEEKPGVPEADLPRDRIRSNRF